MYQTGQYTSAVLFNQSAYNPSKIWGLWGIREKISPKLQDTYRTPHRDYSRNPSLPYTSTYLFASVINANHHNFWCSSNPRKYCVGKVGQFEWSPSHGDRESGLRYNRTWLEQVASLSTDAAHDWRTWGGIWANLAYGSITVDTVGEMQSVSIYTPET